MSDLIKKIKIKKQDGTFTDYIPIGAKAVNVSMNNGKNVQSIIGNIDVDRDGSIAEQLDKYKDYDSGIKTLKADGTEEDVYFYLEDMEDGTYVVKNIGKEYSVLCYPEFIEDKTDKTYNIYSHISLYNNDILQLFKVGDNINSNTRIRYIPTNDSEIACFSIEAINAESDGTSYSWRRDYIRPPKNDYSTSMSDDTYNCYYLNDKLVNVGAEEDDNFKVNFIKSKNLYNPSYRANDGTIKGAGGTRTENNGVFTMVASANDCYFWEVTNQNSPYMDGKGELYEFKKDSYTISLSNTAFNLNFVTYYDENKISLGWDVFKNSTFTMNKKTGAKYFTLRFGKNNASPGTTYSTTIQLEEGNQASAYKPFVPTSIYVDNEKFTETIGVGSSVDSNYRTNILYNKNLLYEVTLTNEYRLNATGGLIDETGWSTTDYIEVEENTEYIINITRTSEFHRICFYNNSKVFLSKDETVNATFTTPANTKYIRFSSYTADFSGGILQKGSLFTIPSIVVDNEKFTETIGVGTSVNSANRVNVLHSKNLFNGNSFSNRSEHGVTTTFNNSEITFNGTTSGVGDLYTTTYGFYLEAGTYTFKFSRKSGTYTANGGSSAIIIKKPGGTEIKHFEFNYFVVGNSYSYTFTLNRKTQIGIQIYANSLNQVFSNLILEVQFEKGLTATTYEPYVTPSIVVDNEEIYTKGQNEEYSTAETVIGTWMGKPLYRKVFTITNLTSSNTNLVDVSWLSIDFAKISGTIIASDGSKFPINLYDSASNYSVIILSSSGYIRGRGAIGSGTLSECIVILEYTKTTD